MKKHIKPLLLFGCLLFVAHAFYCCVPVVYQLPSERAMQMHALQILVRRLALACQANNELENLKVDDLTNKKLQFLQGCSGDHQTTFAVVSRKRTLFQQNPAVTISVSVIRTNGCAQIYVSGVDKKDEQQLKHMFNYYLDH